MPVARLVAAGKAQAMITQNVDNLHQAAGVPADRVIELHGNASYATCLECGLRHELADLKALYQATGDLPACRECGGIVKTATISFGQPLPESAMARAEVEAMTLRPLPGAGLVAGGDPGQRLPAARPAERRGAGHRQPRSDLLRRRSRPRAPRRDRPDDERGGSGERPRTRPRSGEAERPTSAYPAGFGRAPRSPPPPRRRAGTAARADVLPAFSGCFSPVSIRWRPFGPGSRWPTSRSAGRR